MEMEAWKLGIPVVTRHREVAPGQYELATHFDRSIIAADQNVLIMEVIKKVSKKHQLKALFHEKPFARVNGSGKHNNWSMGTDKIGSFFNGGEHPENNMKFMLFLAATIRAVHLHGDLLRLSVTGYSNDFRLGANEAPPSIMSMFLGQDLIKSVELYLSGKNNNSFPEENIDLGVHSLPLFKREPADRNRTSPFAFTGNKFEFRAVGSSQQVMRSNLMITTMMADSIKYMANEIEAKKSSLPLTEAVREVIRQTISEHKDIIFDGNNYSQEWKSEAARRGLPRYDTTPEALPQFTSQKNIQLFKSLNIMSETELSSRKSIFFDEYIKKVLVEAKMSYYLARRYILPAAYNSLPIYNAAGIAGDACSSFSKTYSQTVNEVEMNVSKLSKVTEMVIEHSKSKSDVEVSNTILSDLIPSMDTLRHHVDILETLIDYREWPLPTYHEMLFHQ